MWKTETLKTVRIENGYVFSINRYDVVTNMKRMNKRDVLTILLRLSDMGIVRHERHIIKANINALYTDIKWRGHLEKYVDLKFQKITDLETGKIKHDCTINCDSFGGGSLEKLKVILV